MNYEVLANSGEIGPRFENFCRNEIRKAMSHTAQFPEFHFKNLQFSSKCLIFQRRIDVIFAKQEHDDKIERLAIGVRRSGWLVDLVAFVIRLRESNDVVRITEALT